MNNRTTKRDHYENIIAVLRGDTTSQLSIEDEIAFCEKEIEALDRRSERARQTAAEKRNTPDELYGAVLVALSDEFEAIDAITGRVEFDGATRNKVANRLNKIANAGQAEKGEIKITGSDGKSKSVVAYRAI